MFKRAALILLSLCLFCAAAFAEEPMYRFCYDPAETDFEIPEGLEPMYALMAGGSVDEKVTSYTLTRMPYGRCLISFVQTEAGKSYRQDELCVSLDAVIQSLAKQALWVGEAQSGPCDFYGFPAAHIETDFAAGNEKVNLMTHANCWLFSDGTILKEVWQVEPAEPIYLYDEQAAEELKKDLTAAEELLGAVFADGEVSYLYEVPSTLAPSTAAKQAAPIESELYTDPAGMFTMQIPAGAVVLTPASTDAELDVVRALYTAANPAGADSAFDLYVQDIREENGTLIFTPDMQGLIQMYRDEVPDWKGVVTEDLAQLAGSIEDNLAKEYGFALCVVSEEEEIISGVPHVREVYILRDGELTLTLSVLGCIEQDGILREVDVFAADSALFDSLYRLAVDSVQYILPQ